jgi:hypothetical protein
MDGKWIVPGRFEDFDVLYLFEALTELVARVDGFEEGDVPLDELILVASDVKEKLAEIEGKVSIPRVYLDS